jgi:hypothetical protein
MYITTRRIYRAVTHRTPAEQLHSPAAEQLELDFSSDYDEPSADSNDSDYSSSDDDSYDANEDPLYDPYKSEGDSSEEEKEEEQQQQTPYLFPTSRYELIRRGVPPLVQPVRPSNAVSDVTPQLQPRPTPVHWPSSPSNGGWRPATEVININNRHPRTTTPLAAAAEVPLRSGVGTASPSKATPSRSSQGGQWRQTGVVDLSNRGTPATAPTAGTRGQLGSGTAGAAPAGLFRRNTGQTAAANRPRQQGGGSRVIAGWAFRN